MNATTTDSAHPDGLAVHVPQVEAMVLLLNVSQLRSFELCFGNKNNDALRVSLLNVYWFVLDQSYVIIAPLYYMSYIPVHDPNCESGASVILMVVPAHVADSTNKLPCLAYIDCLNALISQSQFSGLLFIALKYNISEMRSSFTVFILVSICFIENDE